jgi:hypothetical protein
MYGQIRERRKRTNARITVGSPSRIVTRASNCNAGSRSRRYRTPSTCLENIRPRSACMTWTGARSRSSKQRYTSPVNRPAGSACSRPQRMPGGRWWRSHGKSSRPSRMIGPPRHPHSGRPDRNNRCTCADCMTACAGPWSLLRQLEAHPRPQQTPPPRRSRRCSTASNPSMRTLPLPTRTAS